MTARPVCCRRIYRLFFLPGHRRFPDGSAGTTVFSTVRHYIVFHTTFCDHPHEKHLPELLPALHPFSPDTHTARFPFFSTGFSANHTVLPCFFAFQQKSPAATKVPFPVSTLPYSHSKAPTAHVRRKVLPATDGRRLYGRDCGQSVADSLHCPDEILLATLVSLQIK